MVINIASKPKLSLIVVVYSMQRQAMNTLFSLSTAYQQGVNDSDYEVIVIENSSPSPLNEKEVFKLGENFHYYYRNESTPTPVYAANFGIQQANAEHICLLIDGARMLTPRVISYTLSAIRMNPKALIVAPGYHLGKHEHQFHKSSGYNNKVEQDLLEEIDWRNNGYRLFDISCFSGANERGFFHPLMESNCPSFSLDLFQQVGGINENFQQPGGGSVNLDLYRNLALTADQLILLPGEGSFHQFHHGASTTELKDRRQLLEKYNREYREIRGTDYKSAMREPVLFGAVTSHALPFLKQSSEQSLKRFQRFKNQSRAPWEDEPDITAL